MTKVLNRSGEQIGFVEASKSSRNYTIRIQKRAEAVARRQGISIDEARSRILGELGKPISLTKKISKGQRKKIRQRIIARSNAKKHNKKLQELLTSRLVQKQAEKNQKRKLQAEVGEEQRKKTATMARRHPLGFMIGETQVTQYKSPGSNLRWATKRKRKP